MADAILAKVMTMRCSGGIEISFGLASLLPFIAIAALASPVTDSHFLQSDIAREFFGISAEHLRAADFSAVKIAVLSEGLGGLENGPGRYFPASARVTEKYKGVKTQPFRRDSSRGRRVGQVIWGILGNPSTGPNFHFFNTNGPKNLELAIAAVREWKADIVVFADVYPTFGDFDGRGPINEKIDELSRDGVLWVQRAGDSRRSTVSAPLYSNAKGTAGSDWIKFESGGRIHFKSNLDQLLVQVTASWEGFPSGEEVVGTDRDLDLFVYSSDPNGKAVDLVASAVKRQFRGARESETDSPFAKEQLRFRAFRRPGYYVLWLRDISGNFSGQRVRIQLQAVDERTGEEKSAFVDGASGEEILPLSILIPERVGDGAEEFPVGVPADSHTAVVVGDFSPDCSYGRTADGRLRPSLLLDRAVAHFSDNTVMQGSVIAAAQAAAFHALMKAIAPTFRRDHHLLALARIQDQFPLSRYPGYLAQEEIQTLYQREYSDWDLLFLKDKATSDALSQRLEAAPEDSLIFSDIPMEQVRAHGRLQSAALSSRYGHDLWVVDRNPWRLKRFAHAKGNEANEWDPARFFLYFKPPHDSRVKPVVQAKVLRANEALPPEWLTGGYRFAELREFPLLSGHTATTRGPSVYSRRFQMPSVRAIRQIVAENR